MLYKYTATTPEGEKRSGSIEAPTSEIAVNSLQNRNLIIVSLVPSEGKGFFAVKNIEFFQRVKHRDIVVLSRQLATLFEANVPVLESLKMLTTEIDNSALQTILGEIVDDIQGGIPMSQAMAKHPLAFSRFFVSMVRSGEESGKLGETFAYLADYLERSYELSSKAKNSLIYPIFVISALVVVFILMLVFVVPRLTSIIVSFGQEIPFFTRVIIGISDFLRNFGVPLLILLVVGIVFLWRYLRTKEGKIQFSRFQLSLPVIGDLYRKYYLSHITDNIGTSLTSGISMVRALEIASDVVGQSIYEKILLDSVNEIKAGNSLSGAFAKYEEIPSIVSQMVKTGEETGKLNFILKNLAGFYKREVDSSLDTLVTLIEPALMIVLGVAVGFFIISIVGPVYNITAGL